jgi:hypothetical protein
MSVAWYDMMWYGYMYESGLGDDDDVHKEKNMPVIKCSMFHPFTHTFAIPTLCLHLGLDRISPQQRLVLIDLLRIPVGYHPLSESLRRSLVRLLRTLFELSLGWRSELLGGLAQVRSDGPDIG